MGATLTGPAIPATPPPRPAAAAAVAQHTALVGARLLDLDPDLGDGIPPEQLVVARQRTIVLLATVPAGPFEPADLRRGGVRDPFAALVVGGLLTRECRLGNRTTTQLLGPGDVLPLAPSDGLAAGASAMRAATATRIAVLDNRFLAAAQRWPWLTARLVERTARWADRALEHQAISQLPRVDARIVALLWTLAERWGRVTAGGVVVPLTLTHEAIGTLVGAQRPTVTLALRELDERGAVSRHEGAWLLAPDSETLVATAVAPDRLATASLRLVAPASAPAADTGREGRLTAVVTQA